MTLTGWPLWWRMLAIGALWGFSFPLLRLVALEMPPMALAAMRGLFAALGVFLFLFVMRRLTGPLQIRHWLVLGSTNGWVPNLLTAFALSRIEAAPAALIHATTPLIVALMAIPLLREERPGPRSFGGMALAFGGIALILGPAALAGTASFAGGLMILLSCVSYAAGTIYARKVRPGAPAQLAFGQQFVSGAMAGLVTLGFEGGAGFAQPAWIVACVALLGMVASALPLTMFLSLIARARATDAAMVGYLQPPFAAALGALMLGEVPSLLVLAGGAVVLAGVWLGTTRPLAPGSRSG